MYYPIKTLGPGNRFGIWVIGCSHACLNCCNPELWSKNPDKEISLSVIKKLIQSITEPVDGITISGGEPFEQAKELAELVAFLHEEITEDILIYTGYTIEELRKMNDKRIDFILKKIAVLIDGKYEEALNDNLPLRGSSNQNVHLLNESYLEKYEPLLHGERKVQTVTVNNNVLAFGIPIYQTKQNLKKLLSPYGISLTKPSVGGSSSPIKD